MGDGPNRKRGQQQQAWRASAGGNDDRRGPQYKWKPAEQAAPGTWKRRLKWLALLTGALACVAGFVAMILLLRPTPRATLVAVAADPAADADRLDVPPDLYGWQTAGQFIKLGRERADAPTQGLWSRKAPPPPTGENGGPLALPGTEDGLADWVEKNRLGDRAYNPLVIYVGLHGGVDANGQPFLFTGGRGPDGRPNRLPVAALLRTLSGGKLEGKKKVLILDCGRLPPDPAYGQLHDDFAARVKALPVADPKLVVMCGADDGQRGWESEELHATAFGHAVLRALRGDVETGGTNVITARQLFESARRQTKEWAQNNRPSAQEPVLLGGNADDIEVGPKPDGKPDDPAPAEFDPGDLRTRWQKHDDLAARTPGPAAYAPRAWRRYRELLLRYEQAVRAGEAATAGRLDEELKKAEAAIARASALPRQESDRNSLALWEAVHAGGAAPPDPGRTTLAADPNKTNLPAAESDRVGFADALLRQLAGGPTGSRAGFADRLPRAAALLGKFDADQRPAEAHLPVMVDQFYHKLLNPAPAAVPGEWADAVALRVAAERAAVGTLEARDPLPGRLAGQGPPAVYPERLWPLTRAAVLAGDAERRPAEDRLFASDPAAHKDAADGLAKARADYAAAAKVARVARYAFDVRDTAFADLPYLTRWAADRAGTAGVKDLTDLWGRLHKLAADLDALPDKAPPPGDTDPKKASAFAEEVQSVEKESRDVADGLTRLRGEFDAELEHQLATDAALQGAWGAKQQLLSAPLIPAEKRANLLAASRRASRALLTAANQPKTAGGDQKAGAKEAAEARGLLARAELGAELFDAQHKDGGALPKADFLDKDLLDLRTDANWTTLAAKVGNELADHLAKLSEAKPPITSAPDAAAERLSRVALPFGAVEGWEPAAANYRLRWRDLLAGLAGRTADDHWYDEAAGGAAATPDAGVYYRRAANRYIADARKVTAGLGVPEFAPGPRLAAELNAPPLSAPSLGPVTWTSERDREIKFAADKLPAGYPVSGFAVGLLRLTAADPLKPEGTDPAARPLLPVRDGDLKLDAKLALDPQVLTVPPGRAAAVTFYFRGQHPTQTQAIDLRRRPDLVLSDPLPAEKEKGAMVAVRAGKGMEGSVAILLDYSGSMKKTLDGKDLNDWAADPASKINMALNALEKALRGLPQGTPLRVRTFSDAKDEAEASRLVYGTGEGGDKPVVRWSTEDPTPLANLMGRLRGMEPKWFTPLIRSIKTAADEDFDHTRDDPKTLVVLTDGADERRGDEQLGLATRLGRMEAAREEMYDKLRARGVRLLVIQVGLNDTDQKLSDALFKDLDGQAPPGHLWRVNAEGGRAGNKRAEIERALLDAIRPRLQLKGGQPLVGFPREGWPSRTAGDTGQGGRGGLYWSRPVPPGTYAANPVPGRGSSPAKLELRDGDRMILEFAPGERGRGVVIRRLLYADLLFNLKDPLLVGRRDVVSQRADKQWWATVPMNYVYADRKEPQYRATVMLERVPSDPENPIELVRPTPPDGLLWWDAAPDGAAASPSQGTVTVTKRYGYAAPAWDVHADNWPRGDGGFARAQLKVWVADSRRAPLPPPPGGYELDKAYKVSTPDGDLAVRVSHESQPILPGDPGEPDKPAGCLVVRVTFPAGRPVMARLDDDRPHHSKHSYYGIRQEPKGQRTGEYTALFGPFSRDELTTAKLRLELTPVGPVLDREKDLAITLIPPQPGTSFPQELDYQPQPALGPDGK